MQNLLHLHLRFHHMRSQLRQTSGGLVTEHESSNFGMSWHVMPSHGKSPFHLASCPMYLHFKHMCSVQAVQVFFRWFGEMCRCRAPKPTAFELGALKVLASSLPCKSCQWNGDNRTRINNGTQMTQKSLSFLIVWQCMTPGMRNWRSRKVGPMLFLCVPYASTENFGQYLTCLTSLEDRQRKNLQGSVWFRMVPW